VFPAIFVIFVVRRTVTHEIDQRSYECAAKRGSNRGATPALPTPSWTG
jgi:hypothetical protein